MSSRFPSIRLDNIQDPNGLARVIRSAIDMLNETET
jgi:hypothetical protein